MANMNEVADWMKALGAQVSDIMGTTPQEKQYNMLDQIKNIPAPVAGTIPANPAKKKSVGKFSGADWFFWKKVF